MKTTEQSMSGWYFLVTVIAIYITTYLFNPEIVVNSLTFFVNILKKILPVLVLVFILLIITNFYVDPVKISKYLGKESGHKAWIIAALAGIISTGPIYVWYPLLNNLQKHKVRDGLIASFLYTRAIKPALLPFLIYYFGITFTVILTLAILVGSFFQGQLVEKLMEVKT